MVSNIASRASLVAGFAAVLALGLAVSLGLAGAARAGVSLHALVTGSMQNFTAHPDPKPIAEASFTDRQGNRLTLADFRGRVILLNLWATWCGPCRTEMPGLDRLQAEFGGDDFQVLALAVDRGGMDKVLDFFAEIGLKHLTPYLDKSIKSLRTLRAFGLPTTVLIDRDGSEVGRLIGPAEWDSGEAKALLRYFIDRRHRT